jgi:hypothetical protein
MRMLVKRYFGWSRVRLAQAHRYRFPLALMLRTTGGCYTSGIGGWFLNMVTPFIYFYGLINDF